LDSPVGGSKETWLRKTRNAHDACSSLLYCGYWFFFPIMHPSSTKARPEFSKSEIFILSHKLSTLCAFIDFWGVS
jgi:hypothetical protein